MAPGKICPIGPTIMPALAADETQSTRAAEIAIVVLFNVVLFNTIYLLVEDAFCRIY